MIRVALNVVTAASAFAAAGLVSDHLMHAQRYGNTSEILIGAVIFGLIYAALMSLLKRGVRMQRIES